MGIIYNVIPLDGFEIMQNQMFEEPIILKSEIGQKLTKLIIGMIFLGIKSHNQSIECNHFHAILQILRQNEYGSRCRVISLICTYT